MKDGVSRFPTPTRGGNIIDIDKAIQDCKEILGIVAEGKVTERLK